MKWTEATYNNLMPVQRGHVVIDNLSFLQALEYMTENGCRWRVLLAHFGHWFTVFVVGLSWAFSTVLRIIYGLKKFRRRELRELRN
jgi:transposase